MIFNVRAEAYCNTCNQWTKGSVQVPDENIGFLYKYSVPCDECGNVNDVRIQFEVEQGSTFPADTGPGLRKAART